MKKPYYVIREVSEEDHQVIIGDPKTEEIADLNDERFFFGGREFKINDKIYLVVPLSEICRVFAIKQQEFLTNELMDVMNALSKKHGHPVIVNIEE
jgi:thymidine kinase